MKTELFKNETSGTTSSILNFIVQESQTVKEKNKLADKLFEVIIPENITNVAKEIDIQVQK